MNIYGDKYVSRNTSGYMLKERPGHKAIDTRAGVKGTLHKNVEVFSPVEADCDGVYIGYNGGRGNYVVLRTEHAKLIAQHFESIHIRNGDHVLPGTIIGIEGWTGNVDPANVNGSHTHWELTIDGKPESPEHLLNIPNVVGAIGGDVTTPMHMVYIDYASIGDRKNLKDYAEKAALPYEEMEYTGSIIPPEGNELKVVSIGPMTQGDLDNVIELVVGAELKYHIY